MNIRLERAGLSAALLSFQVNAETPFAVVRPQGPEPALVMTGLLLVLLLLALFFLVLRRYGPATRVPSEHFQVIAVATLGTRERVVLLQAGRNKQLVLGVCPGRINTLCVLEGQDTIDLQGKPANNSPDFLQKLTQAMQK